MNKSEFRDLLVKRFSLSELSNLCMDLNIKYESIPGDTIEAKAQGVIEYCSRHEKLDQLVNHCCTLRPNVNWKDVSLVPQIPEFTRERSNFLLEKEIEEIKSRLDLMRDFLANDVPALGEIIVGNVYAKVNIRQTPVLAERLDKYLRKTKFVKMTFISDGEIQYTITTIEKLGRFAWDMLVDDQGVIEFLECVKVLEKN